MRHMVMVICFALVIGVGTAAASAGKSGPTAWTESKAERLVLGRATVRLAGEDRAALVEELREAVGLYWMLALEATVANEGHDVASVYVQLAYRYGRALVRVRDGLGIEAANCSGAGVAANGRRFTSFRCSVTSESVEIPSVELDGNGDTPVEGEPRSVGPIDAQLEVRVTGTSTFAYRKV